MKKQKSYRLILTVFLVLLVGIVLAAMCIGRYSVSSAEVLRYLFFHVEDNKMITTVMWSVRIPRILMALIVGAGLSVSGVSLQAMFGNPLVNAHILGVSYSAGFGADSPVFTVRLCGNTGAAVRLCRNGTDIFPQ